ncbi:cupin domain-containing protein [Streptomyces sp. NPDC002680]|uniref:cupin domain-containing protein n=1 Tax=Streptomyces sp. NPDC002680 TaxID=3364659 RepID=UPI0036BB6BA0
MSNSTRRPTVDMAPGAVREVSAAHGGVGVTALRPLATTQGAPFYVLDWEFPPGTSEGAHHHRDEPIGVEHYVVVRGTVVIVVDGEAHELTAGDAMAIPPHCVREVRNHFDRPARVLLTVERLVAADDVLQDT